MIMTAGYAKVLLGRSCARGAAYDNPSPHPASAALSQSTDPGGKRMTAWGKADVWSGRIGMKVKW